MAGEKKQKKGINLLYSFLLFLLIICTLTFILVLWQNVNVNKQLQRLDDTNEQLKSRIDSIEMKLDDIEAFLNDSSDELIEEALAYEDIDNSLEDNIEQLESKVIWDNFDKSANTWDSNLGIRRVYLTFDDGPSSNTDRILDILDEYGVKATFFVVGKEGYNAQYQRIVNDGHTLGMHSYSHRYGEIYKSLDSYRTDLYKLHDFLYEVTGVDSRVVRFPGGSSNTVSRVNIQDLISFLNQEGLVYYDWNVSSGDATSSYVSAETIRANVLNNTKKYNSVIILFHDSSDKGTTVQALPGIIESILKSDNTVLLPITEDTIPVQHIMSDCQ